MKKPFVSLRSEITRAHALILMDWLEDERVTRYLSDSANVSRFIGEAVNRSQMPILTPMFNHGGRFFMVYDRNDVPVGFVRLVKSGPDCEIVLIIGEHDNWGRRLGASAILEGLKIAFLEMRAKTVVARIHPENSRSLRAFQRLGFALEREVASLKTLSINSLRYRQLVRQGVTAGSSAGIYITEVDKARIEEVIALERGPGLVELEHEIERAIVVAPQHVGREVVTMNSRVALSIDDDQEQISLVYPSDADERSGKLSVLSDIGAVILGYQEGNAIDWMVGERTRRILIERVIYQPESAGHFHL